MFKRYFSPSAIKDEIIITLAFVILCTIFLGSKFYQDIKTNKFFNYPVIHSSAVFKDSTPDQLYGHGIISGEFTAADNYLGSVNIRLKTPGDLIAGEGIFKIKEKGQKSWYFTGKYSVKSFDSLSFYPFGFPPIKDSKNKTYDFELSSVNAEAGKDIIRGDYEPIFISRYVFPREIILASRNELVNLIVNRGEYIIQIETPTLFIFFLIYVITLFLYLSLPKRQKEYLKSVYKSIRPWKSVLKSVARINFFYIATALIPVLAFNLLIRNYVLAEQISVWIWGLLVIGLVRYFAIFFDLKERIIELADKLGEVDKYLSNKNIRRWLFISIAIAILFFSAINKYYYLGGDDSRFFYVYPQEYLENVINRIGPNDGLSNLDTWLPFPSIASFVSLLTLLKVVLINFNLQSFLYALNIILGFLFFYKCFILLINREDKYAVYTGGITALLYVSSIFNMYSLFNSQLIAIFLLSIIPLSLYLFIKGLKKDRTYYSVCIAIIWFLFSLLAVALPWWGATLLVLAPLLVSLFLKYKGRFIKHSLVLVVCLVLLNINWLYLIPSSSNVLRSGGVGTNSITSQQFRTDNASGIQTTTSDNKVMYPLLNLYNYDIQKDFNWPYLNIFQNWYLKLLPLNLVFALIIFLAGARINLKDKLINIYVISAICFVLAIYFYVVNITSWGVDLFIWFNNTIPGFVAFRNMYDKFAPAMGITFSLLFAVSLLMILDTVKTVRTKNWIILGVLFVVLLNAKPFLFGDFTNLPFWTTQNTYNSTKEFNSDFNNLVGYIKANSNHSKYLSLPLNSGNAFLVEDDKQPNHFYNGVSPILILTGKNDFSGILSFGQFSDEVKNDIYRRDYEDLNTLFSELNINYIILDKDIPPELQKSYMFSDGLYFAQDQRFLSAVLGDKIKDFGNRYSLYKVKGQFSNDKLYLSNNSQYQSSSRVNLKFNEETSYEYNLQINNLEGTKNLIFLNPFMNGWGLYLDNNKKLDTSHFLVFNYANGWGLNADFIKALNDRSVYQQNPDGSINIHLKLHYDPYQPYWILTIFSWSFFGLLIIYVAYSYFWEKHEHI